MARDARNKPNINQMQFFLSSNCFLNQQRNITEHTCKIMCMEIVGVPYSGVISTGHFGWGFQNSWNSPSGKSAGIQDQAEGSIPVRSKNFFVVEIDMVFRQTFLGWYSQCHLSRNQEFHLLSISLLLLFFKNSINSTPTYGTPIWLPPAIYLFRNPNLPIGLASATG